jgi:hypothetical protein
MVAGPFLFALQIGDGPITGASRWFDFLPVLEPLFGVAGYLRWCSPAVQNRPGAVLLRRMFRPSHSIMDEFQDRLKDETRDFHRRSRANGVWAFRLARQMNMDGLHVENRGAALSMPLGLQLGGETIVCLRKSPEIGECCVSSADFVAGHDHDAIPFACERFEMNAVNSVSEHQLAAIWLAH